ncbi:MAG: c-type cytochrome [Candidatus Hydrothermarchaeaceae archaeon]
MEPKRNMVLLVLFTILLAVAAGCLGGEEEVVEKAPATPAPTTPAPTTTSPPTTTPAPTTPAPTTPAPTEAPVEEEHAEEEAHGHAEVPAEYASLTNPYWNDKVADYETAKAEGQDIYVQKCQVCHGATGLGEQETSIPGATNFGDTVMIAAMSDAFWYWRIAEGVPGTAMAAWKDQLTAEEIWKVMVYEHTFSHDEAHAHGAMAEEEHAH